MSATGLFAVILSIIFGIIAVIAIVYRDDAPEPQISSFTLSADVIDVNYPCEGEMVVVSQLSPEVTLTIAGKKERIVYWALEGCLKNEAELQAWNTSVKTFWTTKFEKMSGGQFTSIDEFKAYWRSNFGNQLVKNGLSNIRFADGNSYKDSVLFTQFP